MEGATASLSLEKGQKIDLTKGNASLKEVNIGLGWDVREGAGDDYDLDAFALLLQDGKLKSDNHIVYFNNLKVVGVEHLGDNLTGAGDGDDETIKVHLDKVPADVDQIIFAVNIYKADERHHENFGQVHNAFIRGYNAETNDEAFKYDLSEDYSTNTGVVVGKLYRKDGEWKFQALGEGHNGTITTIAATYR